MNLAEKSVESANPRFSRAGNPDEFTQFYLNEDIEASFQQVLQKRLQKNKDPSEFEFNHQTLDKLYENKVFQTHKVKQYDPIELLNTFLLKKSEYSSFSSLFASKYKSQINKSELPLVVNEEIKMISLLNSKFCAENSAFSMSLTVSHHLIAVGQSTGSIFLYDQNGQFLKELKGKSNISGVTCLDISFNEKIIVSGHESGTIIFWSIEKGKILGKIDSLNNKPITKIRFWKESDCNNAISGDTDGKVQILCYKKSISNRKIESFIIVDEIIGCILDFQIQDIWVKNEEKCRFIAMIGSKSIFIYVFEPEIKKFFSISKEQESVDFVFPCARWSLVSENSEIYNFFCVSWGNTLSIYKFNEANPEKFILFYFFTLEQDVLSFFWLSPYIIFLYESNNHIRILKYFKEKYEIRNFLFPENVFFQSYAKSGSKIEKNFENSFCFYENKIYVMGKKKFFRCFLHDWKGCLKELVKKNDWLSALTLGILFYNEKYNKTYQNTESKEEKANILQILVKNYINISMIPLKYRIYNSIEFCLELKLTNFVYVDLYEYFLTENSEQSIIFFIKILEKLILSGKIDKIPSTIISKMNTFYEETKNLDTFEEIILHFNPSLIKSSIIFEICAQNNFFTGLIYISMNSIPENFLLPLKVIYKTIIQKSEENLEKFQKISLVYKLLWHVKNCFLGKKFPNNEISKESFEKNIPIVIKWFFKWKHLKEFAKIDLGVLLNIIKYVFQLEPCLKIIQNHENHLKIPTDKDILDTLLYISQEESRFTSQISIFCIYILSQTSIKTEKNIILCLIKNLFQQSSSFSNDIISGSDIDEYIQRLMDANPDFTIFEEFSLESLDLMASIVLKKFQNSFTTAEIDQIYVMAQFSAYTEILLFIYETKKDFKSCFDYLIKSSNSRSVKNVFNWLNQKFFSLEEQDQKIFKMKLNDFLRHLGKIDLKETENLIFAVYQSSLLEVINFIDDFPVIQKNIFSAIEIKLIPGNFMAKYIEIIAKSASDELIPFFQNLNLSDFDTYLDKFAEICVKNDQIHAGIYLLEQQQKIDECLSILINQIENIKQEIEYFASKSIKLGKKSEKIQTFCEYVLLSGQITQKNIDDFDLEKIQIEVLKILFIAVDFYLNLKQKGVEDIEEHFQSLLKNFLVLVEDFLGLDLIIHKMTQKFPSMPLKFFKQSFIHVLSVNNYRKSNLRKIINLIDEESEKKRRLLYCTNLKGLSCSSFCLRCGESLCGENPRTQKVVAYLCGHYFHKTCVDSKTCWACFDSEKKRSAALYFTSKN